MKKAGLVVVLCAAVCALALPAAPAVARNSRSRSFHAPYSPTGWQEVATLRSSHRVYRRPHGSQIGLISGRTPITKERTSLPVLRTVVRRRSTWLQVMLPGRPNGHTGWIRAGHTHRWRDGWHIEISTGRRRAYVYYRGRLLRDWLVAVGAPGTPTPHGRFFVQENVMEPADYTDGHYVLATSARSTVFSSFDGGPGQVALHGLVGAAPGMAASHGCIQLPSAALSWLAPRIPTGTPVTITA